MNGLYQLDAYVEDGIGTDFYITVAVCTSYAEARKVAEDMRGGTLEWDVQDCEDDEEILADEAAGLDPYDPSMCWHIADGVGTELFYHGSDYSPACTVKRWFIMPYELNKPLSSWKNVNDHRTYPVGEPD